MRSYERTHGRHGRGWSLGLLVCALALAMAFTPPAVADSMVGLWRGRFHSVMWQPRDPVDLLSELEPVLARPVVALNREDAVALEILQATRTLSDADALRVARTIVDEGERLGLDPLLFLAMIHVESCYDHLAISPVGAEGLMQLMPDTAEWTAAKTDLNWAERHSFDPVLNVQLGARYFRHLQREFRRLDAALTAYNRGPEATRFLQDETGELPEAIVEFYAGKVLDRYHHLRAQYGQLALR